MSRPNVFIGKYFVISENADINGLRRLTEEPLYADEDPDFKYVIESRLHSMEEFYENMKRYQNMNYSDYINTIEYPEEVITEYSLGYISENGLPVPTSDVRDLRKNYVFRGPESFIKNKTGISWDHVAFERDFSNVNGLKSKVYSFIFENSDDIITEAFIVYYSEGKYVLPVDNNTSYMKSKKIENIFAAAANRYRSEYRHENTIVSLYELTDFISPGMSYDEIVSFVKSQPEIFLVRNGNECITERSFYMESGSEDSDIEKKWFIKSDDGVDNCCIKVKGYDKPMRGRSAMITLRLDDDKWEVLCKKNTDDYGVPGGGWNKGETPEGAAIRELQEETLSNVKNVKRMGTLIEYSDKVKDWVKEHVPNKDDWWYGYYSAVFVGMYDGKFKGKVKAEDRESGYEWKPVDNRLMKQLPKEYQDAINEYINSDNPFKESVFTEAENDPPPLENNDQQKPTSEEEQSAEEDLSNKEKEGETNANVDANPADTSDTITSIGTGSENDSGQEESQTGTEGTPGSEEDVPGEVQTTPKEVGGDGVEPPPIQQKIPISRPKQFANQEQDKNGVRRKNLYIEFIRWAKEYNPKNIFGSNFDKDIFNGSYPFVPNEMRYFYRLADPTLCILAGGLTFFPVIQLRKLNSENKHLDQYMIFAATDNDMRVFSNVDKRVYMATEQNGEIVLGKALANTFDTYIQTMIDKGDILNGPREDTTLEYVEDLE